MPAVRSELPAIVLDCRDHGEADKIVTFFCQSTGRLTAIAKGAHRSKKRFVNKLEFFSFLQITYSRSSPDRLAVLTDAELIDSFINLRSSYSCYQAASVLREFLLLATSEKLNDDTLFQLSLWALGNLDDGAAPKPIITLTLIKFFDCIGYRPDFSRCQSCGKTYGGIGRAAFDIAAGGIVCPDCRPVDNIQARTLSPGTIRLIDSVQHQPLSRLDRFKPAPAICSEALYCFHRYARHLFQRDIHSWKYLANI